MASQDSVVAFARSLIDTDLTSISDWFGADRVWSAIFVSYVFYHEGMPLNIQTPKGFSHCPSGVEWFKTNPPWQWVDRDSTPELADIVFYDWYPGTSESDAWHAGIIESIDPDGSMKCIDSASINGQRSISMRSYSKEFVYGYARPPFSENNH